MKKTVLLRGGLELWLKSIFLGIVSQKQYLKLKNWNHLVIGIQTSDKGGVLLCRFMSVDFRSLSCPLLLPLGRKIFISLIQRRLILVVSGLWRWSHLPNIVWV